ncbi:MAG: hypothetical protein WCY15_03485 [Phenylobacterium sp.]|jgi:hypothetical protein|uniref:hypothetical protein n=1 Tax=Phenylobacterium sp. TaxID=1871053 RepID=UPI002A29C46D|nr:hypothetical protein [Phenylobacterium sp.]MDD3838422.1 hypothetical protein [Phenylobacterium sp.]MDX9998257.1 hypothetical protein [Phenylobacterium sp.]
MLVWPEELLREGDTVTSPEEPTARFIVIAIHEDKCWVREIATGEDQIVVASSCRRESTYH